jgi:hypothetical protein
MTEQILFWKQFTYCSLKALICETVQFKIPAKKKRKTRQGIFLKNNNNKSHHTTTELQVRQKASLTPLTRGKTGRGLRPDLRRRKKKKKTSYEGITKKNYNPLPLFREGYSFG